MFYLSEAWSLFKKTWWPLVRLFLVTLVLVIPLCVGGAIMSFLAKTHLVAALITGVVLFVAWAAIMSAIWYSYGSLLSWPYFEERPRVWRVVLCGFTYWGRMILLGLCQVLFSLPVVAPMMIIGIGESLRTGGQPQSISTLTLVLSPLTAVLSIYAIFAVLNAVRLDMRAWRSWMSSWKLVPRHEWWKNVGSLVGLQVVFAIAGQLAFLPLRGNSTPSLGAVAGFLTMWLISMFVGLYFMLCSVAIWRRYTHLPETGVNPAASEVGLGGTDTVDAGV